MKNARKRNMFLSIILLVTFAVWTLTVRVVDVQQIGPNKSSVGFATLNEFVHSITGVNFSLYILTDWLGLVPIGAAVSFAILGLTQWIKRKSLLKVDKSLLSLGIFYLTVIAVYAFFELVIINYRPVLIKGCLEASYPSSTTMLVLCVMPTAIMQLSTRVKNTTLKTCISSVTIVFIAFTVICRILSGVHWITDIIGGVLLSAGLVMTYCSLAFESNRGNKTK